jgi:hypothetical protein
MQAKTDMEHLRRQMISEAAVQLATSVPFPDLSRIRRTVRALTLPEGCTNRSLKGADALVCSSCVGEVEVLHTLYQHCKQACAMRDSAAGQAARIAELSAELSASQQKVGEYMAEMQSFLNREARRDHIIAQHRQRVGQLEQLLQRVGVKVPPAEPAAAVRTNAKRAAAGGSGASFAQSRHTRGDHEDSGTAPNGLKRKRGGSTRPAHMRGEQELATASASLGITEDLSAGIAADIWSQQTEPNPSPSPPLDGAASALDSHAATAPLSEATLQPAGVLPLGAPQAAREIRVGPLPCAGDQSSVANLQQPRARLLLPTQNVNAFAYTLNSQAAASPDDPLVNEAECVAAIVAAEPAVTARTNESCCGQNRSRLSVVSARDVWRSHATAAAAFLQPVDVLTTSKPLLAAAAPAQSPALQRDAFPLAAAPNRVGTSAEAARQRDVGGHSSVSGADETNDGDDFDPAFEAMLAPQLARQKARASADQRFSGSTAFGRVGHDAVGGRVPPRHTSAVAIGPLASLVHASSRADALDAGAAAFGLAQRSLLGAKNGAASRSAQTSHGMKPQQQVPKHVPMPARGVGLMHWFPSVPQS